MNTGSPDFKSSVLITRPRRLLKTPQQDIRLLFSNNLRMTTFRDPYLGSQKWLQSLPFPLLDEQGRQRKVWKAQKNCLLYFYLLLLVLNSASLIIKELSFTQENRSTAVKGRNSRILYLALPWGLERLPLSFHSTTLLYYKGFFFSSWWFLVYRILRFPLN